MSSSNAHHSCSCPASGDAAAVAPAAAANPARRSFLKKVALGATALAGADVVAACTSEQLRELPKEEFNERLVQFERDYAAKYGKAVTVGSEKAMPNTVFAYALDISRCVGCRRCVYACVDENNQSRDPQIQWIRVLQMEKRHGIDFAHADPYYQPEKVPEPGHFYVPMACQHCDNPPCVKVCPVGATWKEEDGLVVIDYDWCIGCRYCMAACPYGARRFNWGEPNLPADQVNPNTHWLGNRPRPKGVVEKCTGCIQRTRQGKYPACVEVCPVGARKFGNLLDPDSEVRAVIDRKRVMVLKAELNTLPKFYFYYGT